MGNLLLNGDLVSRRLASVRWLCAPPWPFLLGIQKPGALNLPTPYLFLIPTYFRLNNQSAGLSCHWSHKGVGQVVYLFWCALCCDTVTCPAATQIQTRSASLAGLWEGLRFPCFIPALFSLKPPGSGYTCSITESLFLFLPGIIFVLLFFQTQQTPPPTRQVLT